MVTVFLGMGSNLGDRLGFLRLGLEALARGGLRIDRVSAVVETPAVGYEAQPPFLNLVAACGWEGGAEALLTLIRRVEAEADRIRPFRNAPRTLDVDLIFFGDLIIRSPGLRVPHPRWKERSFVVRPLQQLAPGFSDPETGFTVDEVRRKWQQKPEKVEEVVQMNDLSWISP